MARDEQGPAAVPELPAAGGPGKPRLWVRRPTNTKGVSVVCLSHRLYSYGVHYVPQATRDVGCAGRWEACHWCRDGYDWREKHYLAVLWPRSGAVELLELSAGAVAYCGALQDRTRNHRGCWVKAWRLFDKRNSPERVTVGGRWTEGKLPEEPDVYAELLRYWAPLSPNATGRRGVGP